MKKYSIKKQLEKIKGSQFEHTFVKAPRRELFETTATSDEYHTFTDRDKLWNWIFGEREGKRFISAHTHPYSKFGFNPHTAIPSTADLFYTMVNRNLINTEYIAQQDKKTKKVYGWTALHNLGKEKPEEGEKREKEKWIEQYKRDRNYSVDRIENLAERMGIKIKYHPARGYYLNKDTGNYEKKENGLEKIFSILLLSFAFVFFITQTKMTGNVVSNLLSDNYLTGFFGLLICCFILCLYLILKKKIDKKTFKNILFL